MAIPVNRNVGRATTGAQIVIDRQRFNQAFVLVEAISPGKNPQIWNKALLRLGLAIQEDARLNQIKRGPSIKAAPLKSQLTRRTGQLAGTIRPDVSKIPRELDVFTDSPYGGVHEFGGLIAIPAHSRTSKKGNTHKVKSHTARFPKRPFLEPALEAVVPRFPDIMAAVIEEELR